MAFNARGIVYNNILLAMVFGHWRVCILNIVYRSEKGETCHRKCVANDYNGDIQHQNVVPEIQQTWGKIPGVYRNEGRSHGNM